MIDQDVFNIEWAVICERHNRDPSQVLAARYYQSLSPRMTTEEFRAAARVVFEEREFFPRPVDFIDAIRPSVEAEALEQWELCERVMAGSKEAFMHMSPAGRRTVDLLGGTDRLHNTRLNDVQFVRRDFMKVKSRVVCKSERKLLDASVRLPWRPPWARGVRGPGNGARSRPQ